MTAWDAAFARNGNAPVAIALAGTPFAAAPFVGPGALSAAPDLQFGELYERALGILFHLQKLGAKRGDKLILFLGNNEQFIDAFWGAAFCAAPADAGSEADRDAHRRSAVAALTPTE